MIFEVKNCDTLQEALKAFCEFLQAQNVPPESVFDSRLVACELLSNVLRHTDGEAKLIGDIKDGGIDLKILSDFAFFPKGDCSCADVYSEHGRGLYLVQSVCKEHIFIEEDGIRVRSLLK